MTIPRRLATGSALAFLTTLTALLAMTGVAVAPAEAAGALRARIIFDKSWTNQFDSRVIWRVDRRAADGSWRTVQRRSWRAGSGMPDRDGTHECVRNHGWAPDGTYSFVQYDHYDASYVKGRVFYLGSHRCRHGTWRSQLFIHSEQTAANGQCRDLPGDQRCRWEVPRINDYRSNGCIKMSPGDLAELTRAFHGYFRAGVRYSTSRVSVVVRP